MNILRVINQFLITLFFLFLLIGCQSEETPPSSDLDLVQYVDSISLPNHLFIEIDPSTIQSIEKAKKHTVDYITLDPDILAETFFRNEKMNIETNAFGIQFRSDNENESLTVYDGGEAFGTANGVDGGFSYTNDLEHNTLYSRVASLSSDSPDLNTQLYEYNLNSDFETFIDLDFLPYLDAKKEIKEQLSTVGFPEIELDVVFALDEKMMDIHQERFLESTNDEHELTVFDLSKDDEAYLFFFRQVIDNVPIINEVWSFDTREAVDPYEPSIMVLYNHNGMVHIDATYLYHILESTEEFPLIKEVEALDLIIDHFSSFIINKQTVIESMELNYVAVHGENEFELVPSWVFRLKIDDVYEDPIDHSKHDVHTYDYFVINAINGERISGVNDKQ